MACFAVRGEPGLKATYLAAVSAAVQALQSLPSVTPPCSPTQASAAEGAGGSELPAAKSCLTLMFYGSHVHCGSGWEDRPARGQPPPQDRVPSKREEGRVRQPLPRSFPSRVERPRERRLHGDSLEE